MMRWIIINLIYFFFILKAIVYKSFKELYYIRRKNDRKHNPVDLQQT